MPKPKTAAIVRNITMLTLAVAASAELPISRPTQIELTVPFSVWSRLATSVGPKTSSSRAQDRPLRQVMAGGGSSSGAGASLMCLWCRRKGGCAGGLSGIAVASDIVRQPDLAGAKSGAVAALGHQEGVPRGGVLAARART
jgi:hypothetical protein